MQQITDFSQSVDNNKIIVNSEKSVLKIRTLYLTEATIF